ncbi:MAG: hypothetical protein MUE49_08895 [Rhodospirillales bacterium]|jgi:VIT1/CCC1 family predicted Fe2+/Mn2+ transporter|nr:hypothetical protein [Rhodospirillales bacterium]
MATETKPAPKRTRQVAAPSLSGGEGNRGEERLIALFFLGCVLFSPLVLQVFKSGMPAIGGLPPLFLYLFGAWAALIAAIALVVETGKRGTNADEAEISRPPGERRRR